MSHFLRSGRRYLGLLGLACALALSARAEIRLPGISQTWLEPTVQGQALVEELNCVACHASEGALAASKKAPRLKEVGARLNPEYLVAFLRDPQGTKPGTTMPGLAHYPAELKVPAEAPALLAAFLSSGSNQRFSQQVPDLVAAQQGERLFHSRGCAACHSPRDAKGQETLAATSVPLGALDHKYSVRSLSDFLRQPHTTRPSGRMPDLRLSSRDIECIANYLVRATKVPGHLAYTLYRGQVWEGLASAEVTAERGGQVDDFSLSQFGKVNQHSAIRYAGWLEISDPGTYTFFLEFNGGSLHLDGQEVVQLAPSDRRGVKQLTGTAQLAAGRRKIEVVYFHTGREAKFTFEMAGPGLPRQAIPAARLSTSEQKTLTPTSASDVGGDTRNTQRLADVAAGKLWFGKLGCANCHDDMGVAPTLSLPFAQLDPQRGCLSTASSGTWPVFAFTKEQRSLLQAVLPKVAELKLTDLQQVNKTLGVFNCLACHERKDLGGISPERNALFTGTAPALGDQGRLPPPLTHVGAKLTPEWLTAVMIDGQRQRNYLDASMPQFGEANVGHLVKLFGQVDKLEAVTFPPIANLQESKHAGYEMVGTNGFSCIACHDYNGAKSSAGALDLAQVTHRLQKNWFALYMRDPSRFHQAVIMPSYWPGGKTIRPNILGGDTAQQIEALWAYLADGGKAKKPLGLSREVNELRVADQAEICRGRGTAGYRGIGVGYPERLSLAFDSEEMALRELWKGDFANVDLGSFRPKGTERISFAAGVPFAQLKSLEAHWPYKGKTDYTFPQSLGYRFDGYQLDERRRPTFLYAFGEIKVTEFFKDMRDANSQAFFQRQFVFQAPAGTGLYYFRAATGKSVTKLSAQVYSVDKLQVRLASGQTAIIREGSTAELLLPLTLPAGTSTLTLEYQW